MSDDERTIDYRSAPSWTATLSITGRADVEIVGLTTVGREPTASTGQVIAIAGDPLVSKLHLALDRNVLSDLLGGEIVGLAGGRFELASVTGSLRILTRIA